MQFRRTELLAPVPCFTFSRRTVKRGTGAAESFFVGRTADVTREIAACKHRGGQDTQLRSGTGQQENSIVRYPRSTPPPSYHIIMHIDRAKRDPNIIDMSIGMGELAYPSDSAVCCVCVLVGGR